MKRTEALRLIRTALLGEQIDHDNFEEQILTIVEKIGMKPPCVDSNRCQVLMQVYIDPSFNMWDEDFDKEERLLSAYNKRVSR